jgi:hypothetical protein
VYTFPADGCQYFDYLMAAGFAVVSEPPRYLDNLRSKLALPRGPGSGPRVLATLDYVEPWYTYNSMTAFPDESARLEAIAIEHRDRADGLVFFANDDDGSLVPRAIIESFAGRYFGPRRSRSAPPASHARRANAAAANPNSSGTPPSRYSTAPSSGPAAMPR